jgi:hypothetical protein
MKTTRFFTLIILAFGFCSCSPKVHKHIIKEMHPVGNDTEVAVYGIGDVVPENAEVIGNVSVLDGGFTSHCDWETVLETAKQEVRASGGNGIEIVQHSYPGQNGSSCHQITAYMLNISDDIEPIALSEEAQEDFHDYVVMKDGDTIPCRITDKTNNTITFLYERNGIRRLTSLPLTDVPHYYIDDPVELANRKAESQKKDYNVQIALNGGYAFRTAKFSNDISGDYKDYLKKLMQGPDYGASIRFNIKNGITLGLHYDRFSSSNAAYVYTYDDEGNYYEGNVSNIHTLTFIGVSLGALTANSQNGKHMLNVEGLAGYMGYKDGAEEFGYKYTLTGQTFGLGLAFGYDYRLTQHIAIGAEASYYIGALSKVTYDDGTRKEVIDLGNSKEGLQRFNIKGGIRFYL